MIILHCSLHAGRLTVWGEVPPGAALLRGTCGPNHLRFNGTDATGRAIEIVAPPATPSPFPLGASWAREHVAWLEDQIAIEPASEAKHKQEILAVALEHHIASRFTAFVAVEERVSSEGARVTVVQPVELRGR